MNHLAADDRPPGEHEGAIRPTRPASRGLPLSRQVFTDLLARIREGEFRPGDKLPGEAELMVEYGVGRNTVREAVQGLVALELLEVRPRRGATVLAAPVGRGLSVDGLSGLLDDGVTDDLYEMRLLLETDAAAKAARRHDEAAVAEVRGAHAEFMRAMRAGEPVVEADLQFHYAIARASGNAVLPIMLEAASDLLHRDRRIAASSPGGPAASGRDHAGILEAIEAADPEAARSRMHRHITLARELAAPRSASARDGSG